MKFVHGWAIDYDQSTIDTYRENIKGASVESVIRKDVRDPDLIQTIRQISDIDVFAYGFPCNDFSLVGEHKGIDGEFGPLYAYGLDVLNQFQPKAFIAENVTGIGSAQSGSTFQKILEDLTNCGYDLTVHKFRFEDYGVPQARHRIIIVGMRSDLGLRYQVPAPTHLNAHVSARDAIENPPIKPGANGTEMTRQNPRVIARLQHIKPGENAWNANIPDHLALNVKGAHLSQIYKRLHPDKPAYTVTGSGGGGTHVYHWSEPRALTNRERARLQTFPDWFEFKGTKESMRRQIGMAVPPLGAKVVLEALAKTLAEKKYKSIEPNMMLGQLQML